MATSSSISGYSSAIDVDRSRCSAAAAASASLRDQIALGRERALADLADQDPVELRARAELVRGPAEDALRRADVSEPADRVARALERVGTAHVSEFDDLAFERQQLTKNAPHRPRVWRLSA